MAQEMKPPIVVNERQSKYQVQGIYCQLAKGQCPVAFLILGAAARFLFDGFFGTGQATIFATHLQPNAAMWTQSALPLQTPNPVPAHWMINTLQSNVPAVPYPSFHNSPFCTDSMQSGKESLVPANSLQAINSHFSSPITDYCSGFLQFIS